MRLSTLIVSTAVAAGAIAPALAQPLQSQPAKPSTPSVTAEEQAIYDALVASEQPVADTRRVVGAKAGGPAAPGTIAREATGDAQPAVVLAPNKLGAAPVPGRPADFELNFELGSAKLLPASEKTLQTVAGVLFLPNFANPKAADGSPLPPRRMRIEGHASADGDDAKNQALSEARAKAVMDYLVQWGVPAERLEAHGYGETRPITGIDPNSPRNRRVETSLIPIN